MATDAELLGAWRDGDSEAGARLFDRHFAAVSRFFRNKAGDRVDDLVQTTFVALLEAPRSFRGDGSFKAYVLGVAYNVLRRHFRDSRRDARVELGHVSVEALGVGPSTALDADREQRRLLEGLRRIPVEHQTLLELFYWESLSAPAIASVLEIPEGTVRTRLRRARSLLQAALGEIVESREVLESTLARLEDWAKARRPATDEA